MPMDQKNRIHEIAFSMFTDIGYSGVTMEQIAHSCGIGKATIYKYFPSKEELLLSCIDYFTEKIRDQVDSVISDKNLSPQQKITDFSLPIIQFVSRIKSSVLSDIKRNVPQAYEKINENRRKMIYYNISRVIDEGKENGVLREDLNTILVAHVLIGTMSHLSSPQVLDEIGLPVGQVFKNVLSIIWEGCLNQKNTE